MPNNEEKSFRVTTGTYLEAPALVDAAFDRLRREARYYGLPDIEGIGIRMTVKFSGRACPSQIEALRQRLDQLWLGDIETVTIVEWTPEGHQEIKYR